MDNYPKIVIIDYNNRDTTVLQNIINNLSLNSYIYDDQDLVFKILMDSSISAIFLDVKTMGFNGLKLASFMCGVNKIKHIPLIFQIPEDFFITCSADDCLAFIKYQTLNLDFITKPYKSRVIEGKLNSLPFD